MSNDPVSLSTPDISRFARSVSKQLKDHDGAPSHLSLMNILARASGFKNYQHLKAGHSARQRLEACSFADTTDYRLVERTLQHFDANGQLVRWPSRRPVQVLGLWAMWADLPSKTHLHEREVNAILNNAHLFRDAALLRRSLVGLGLVTRNLDGSDYQRQEKRPPAEALEIFKAVATRRAKAQSLQEEV